MSFPFYFGLLLSAIGLVGCAAQQQECSNPTPTASQLDGAPESPQNRRKLGFGSILGDQLTFGGRTISGRSSKVVGSVSEHLWRASLSTIEFLPLVSSDAVGGVIVTDWYHPDQDPYTQMKVTIYIRGAVLEASALQVMVHKKVLQKNKPSSQWIGVQADPKVAQDLEKLILERARQLRVGESKVSSADCK